MIRSHITPREVHDACYLTPAQVEAIFAKDQLYSPDPPVVEAIFAGMRPNGQLIYELTYHVDGREVIEKTLLEWRRPTPDAALELRIAG